MAGWKGAAIAAAAAALTLSGCRRENAVVYDFVKLRDQAQLVTDTRRIDFGSPEDRRHYQGAAWSNDEKDDAGRTFAWVQARNSSITFEVLTVRGDLLAEINCRALERKSGPPQTLQAALNGQILGRPMELTPEFRSHQLLLPAAHLRAGENRLTFSFAWAGDGSSGGGAGSDVRALAACFDFIAIAPYDETAPRAAEAPRLNAATPVGIKEHLEIAAGSALWYFVQVPEAGRRPELEAECRAPDGLGSSAATAILEISEDRAASRVLVEQRIGSGDTKRIRQSLEPWAGRIVRVAVRSSESSPTYWTRLRLVADPLRASGDDPRTTRVRQQLARSNVLIVLLDAASPSHFGIYGYGKNTTPNMDRIAREGVHLTNAYCNAVYTEASTGSLMTGTYPDVHKVLYPKDKLGGAAYTMAEMLAASGLKTAAFIGNSMAGTLRGYEQGFQTHVELFRHDEYDRKCVNQNIWLFPWLEQNRNNQFFLYLHFREPHFGGPPPQEFLDKFTAGYKGTVNALDDRERINRGEMSMSDEDLRYIAGVYDATLNYADYEIGLVEKKMKELGLWDKTLVLIIADHGEALWEHGYFGHNVQVYQNMAHIPFIVRPPAGGAIPGARKLGSIVETVDIFTTLADVFNSAPGRSQAQGRSLLELLAIPERQRPGLAFTRTLWTKPTYAVRDGRWEYVHGFRFGERELYDLRSDPTERNNLIEGQPILADYFETRLWEWLKTQRSRALATGSPETATIDEATRRNLETLGYIDAATGKPTADHDPK